jgi:hypothetical protein
VRHFFHNHQHLGLAISNMILNSIQAARAKSFSEACFIQSEAGVEADTLAQHRRPLAQPMTVHTMDSLQCGDGGRDGGDGVVPEGAARARQSGAAGSDPALRQGRATLPGVRAPLPPWPARAGHGSITAWARLCRSASVRG